MNFILFFDGHLKTVRWHKIQINRYAPSWCNVKCKIYLLHSLDFIPSLCVFIPFYASCFPNDMQNGPRSTKSNGNAKLKFWTDYGENICYFHWALHERGPLWQREITLVLLLFVCFYTWSSVSATHLMVFCRASTGP